MTIRKMQKNGSVKAERSDNLKKRGSLERRLIALARIQPFLESASVEIGNSRPSREELHEP